VGVRFKQYVEDIHKMKIFWHTCPPTHQPTQPPTHIHSRMYEQYTRGITDIHVYLLTRVLTHTFSRSLSLSQKCTNTHTQHTEAHMSNSLSRR